MKEKHRKKDSDHSRVLKRTPDLHELVGYDEWGAYRETDQPLPPEEAIIARCFLCRFDSDAAGTDCGDVACPLHPYCPYRKSKKHTTTEKEHMACGAILHALVTVLGDREADKKKQAG